MLLLKVYNNNTSEPTVKKMMCEMTKSYVELKCLNVTVKSI